MVLPPAFLQVSTRTGAGLLRSTRCELLLAAGAFFSDFFAIELRMVVRLWKASHQPPSLT
jgi:hypothetical protein